MSWKNDTLPTIGGKTLLFSSNMRLMSLSKFWKQFGFNLNSALFVLFWIVVRLEEASLGTSGCHSFVLCQVAFQIGEVFGE